MFSGTSKAKVINSNRNALDLVNGNFHLLLAIAAHRGEFFRARLRAFHELYSFSHRRRKFFKTIRLPLFLNAFSVSLRDLVETAQ
jgi:hypothetical protein